jgi:hypothetical protein
MSGMDCSRTRCSNTASKAADYREPLHPAPTVRGTITYVDATFYDPEAFAFVHMHTRDAVQHIPNGITTEPRKTGSHSSNCRVQSTHRERPRRQTVPQLMPEVTRATSDYFGSTVRGTLECGEEHFEMDLGLKP